MFAVQSQMLYKGLYQSLCFAPNEYVQKAYEKHHAVMHEFLNEYEDKTDLYTYTNLVSAILNNRYSFGSYSKYSELPYDLELNKKLLKLILYLGKEEAFEIQDKRIFMTIYALKSMVMVMVNAKDLDQEEFKKFEKLVKRVFRLFITILLRDRFGKMMVYDKIRTLFEGINLRVLTKEDIKDTNVLNFFESLIHSNDSGSKNKYASEFGYGDNKFVKMGHIDLFNMVCTFLIYLFVYNIGEHTIKHSSLPYNFRGL